MTIIGKPILCETHNYVASERGPFCFAAHCQIGSGKQQIPPHSTPKKEFVPFLKISIVGLVKFTEVFED